METFTNDKGEEVVIAAMENPRLIHSIAKYAKICGISDESEAQYGEVVKALKSEAINRLAPIE